LAIAKVTNCDDVERRKFSLAQCYAFTEHGAIMAASVVNSPRAVEAGVYVARAIVKHRELIATHKELARKLAELEQKIGTHNDAIRQLIEAIRQLTVPPPQPKRRKIGSFPWKPIMIGNNCQQRFHPRRAGRDGGDGAAMMTG
jgi:hypothetical protein